MRFSGLKKRQERKPLDDDKAKEPSRLYRPLDDGRDGESSSRITD